MKTARHSQLSTLNSPFKQAEVGVIPEDWEVYQLGTLLVEPPKYGINAPSIPFDMRSPTYLRITDISDDGRFIEATKASVKHPEAGKYILSDGDLVFARTGASVGKSYLYDPADGILVFAGFLICVRPNASKLSSKFLKFYTHSKHYWNWVNVNSMRSGQPGINGQEFASLPIAVPPTKAEQEAIVDALSDADALIESLEQLIAKKRQIKQGTMQELLRPRDGWVRKKLGDLASIQRGASPRPIDNPIWFDGNSNVGWVRISDVTRSGMFLRETSQRLSALGIQQSRPVNRGSLIMSICATVGRPIITEIDTCIHDGFVVFDTLRADKHFMYYILKSIENDWTKHGQTGSQMNLNTSLINRTEIVLPPPEEQTAIATILSDMDAEIAALEEKLGKARQLKQGMMQELLTGKTRLVEREK